MNKGFLGGKRHGLVEAEGAEELGSQAAEDDGIALVPLQYVGDDRKKPWDERGDVGVWRETASARMDGLSRAKAGKG